jgi:hypothetical protein
VSSSAYFLESEQHQRIESDEHDEAWVQTDRVKIGPEQGQQNRQTLEQRANNVRSTLSMHLSMETRDS